MPDISTMSAIGGLGIYADAASQNVRAASAATSSTGTSSTSGTSSTESSGNNPYEITMSDFYKLLATQLQYQDADNPMDTSEMVSQLVQTQMSSAIQQMSTAITDLTTVNLMSYASSMMGKEVTIAQVDDSGNYTGEELKGVVTGVSLGTIPTVIIDGKEYMLAQIMGVGNVPSQDEDSGEGGSGSEGSGSGESAGTTV